MQKKSIKAALTLLAFFLVTIAMIYVFVIRQRAMLTNGQAEDRSFVLSPTPANIDFNEMNTQVYIHSIYHDRVAVFAVATNTSDYYFALFNIPTKYKLIGHEWFAMDFTSDEAAPQPAPATPQPTWEPIPLPIFTQIISSLRPYDSAEIIFAPSPRALYNYIGAGTFLFMYELRPDEVRRGFPCRGNEISWVYMIVVIEQGSIDIWQNTYRLYIND